MFNKVFLDALIYFLYINLKNTSVTKYRIAQLLNIFNDEWEKKLKEIKYVKKKLSQRPGQADSLSCCD